MAKKHVEQAAASWQDVARAATERRAALNLSGQCTATVKDTGKRCRARAIANGLCKHHGGAAPVRNRDPANAAEKEKRPHWLNNRGLYADGLFPEEEPVYEAVQVGTLAEEIRLLKVQLRRAVGAQMRWAMTLAELNDFIDSDPSLKNVPEALRQHLEPDSFEQKVSEGKDGGEERKLIRRRRDFLREIRALVKIIADLELRHRDLTKDSSLGSPEMINIIAIKLREFDDASAATMPAFPDDSEPLLIAESENDGDDEVAMDDSEREGE